MKISIVLEALTAGFITDIDRLSKENQKKVKEIQKQWSDAGKAIGVAVAGFIGTGAAALVKWTGDTMRATQQIERLAKIAGTSNTEFQRWAAGAKVAGVEQDKLADILKDVQDKVGDFLQTGGGAMADFFENIAPAVGVTAEQFKKLSGPQALQLYVDSLEKANVTQTEMTFYLEAIASDVTTLLPLLQNGGKRMKEYGDQAERLGAVLSDDAIAQTKELIEVQRELDIQFDAFKKNLIVGLIPSIKELADEINSPQFKAGFGAIITGAVTATVELGKFVAQVGNVTRALAEYTAARAYGYAADDIEGMAQRFRELERERSNLLGTQEGWFKLAGADKEIAKIEKEMSDLQIAIKSATIEKAKLDQQMAAKQSQANQDAAVAGTLALVDALNQESKIKPVVTELDRLAAEAKKNAAEEAEKARIQIEATNRELDRMAASLLPEAERAAEEFNIRVRELYADQKEGKLTSDQLTRALGLLGTEYQRNAKLTAANQDVLGRISKQYAEQAAAIGLTGRELAVYSAVLAATRDAEQTFGDALTPEYLQQVQDAAAKAADSLYALEQAFGIIESAKSPFQRMIEEVGDLREALERMPKPGEIGFSEKDFNATTEAIRIMNHQIAVQSVGALKDAADAMAALFDEGTEGQKRMQQAGAVLSVVQAGLAAIEGVRAVLNQASGDPYSAFARMAAMGAAVAPLLAAIGSAIPLFGGGSSGVSAAQRQDLQGTGSVLGDSMADSESIARGVDITADATMELVGINRGMLAALQSLQAGLAGASTLLARGFGDVGPVSLSNGPSLPSIGGSNSHSLFVQSFANIFGGKESLRDQGVRIVGGTLAQMVDEIMVQSYAAIHRSGGWFSSSKDYDQFTALGDEISAQFQLVLASMADAVRAGADALGLNMDQVNAAIDAFRVEEIRISTMDLSAEEAQKELEAVFGKIFDGLAASVVPFLPQFQRVGEGLGETLVRVATSVQVTHEAMTQLGFALGQLDPEAMARVSTELVEAVGGIESFISGMQSFVSNFATEEHKFQVAQDAITRAFDQFGLAIPATRDGMWELMRSLDATTESGREQIAMLLRLADTSDAYYKMLEQQADAYNDFISQFRADSALPTGADATTVDEALRQSWAWSAAMVEQANALARAAGLAGAAEEDLALIHIRAAEYVLQAADRIAAATTAYEDFIGSIERENKALTAYQAALADANDWYDDAVARANELARAAGLAGAREQDLAAIELRHAQLAAEALRQLQQSAQDLVARLYGPLDIVAARIEELEAANSTAVAGLGDVSDGIESAVNAWLNGIMRVQDFLDSMLLDPSLTTLTPQQQLAEAQRQYDALLAAAQGGDAGALEALPQAANTLLDIARGFWSSGDQYTAIFDAVRAGLSNLPAMAYSTGASGGSGTYTVAASAELQALYIERDRLLAEQEAANRLAMAQQLAGYLVELAAAQEQPILDLARTLGVRLDAFVTDLGVDLSHVSVETVQQLADLSGLLGVSLSDLATSVGVSIGALTDQYSLAAGALAAEILGLPAEQAAALQPYLDAIAAATTAADASAATQAMAGYVSTLDADIRTQLAPYFDGISGATLTAAEAAVAVAESQLSAALESNALLARIADNLFAANVAGDIPAYASGGWVNGPTALLAGEAGRELILPNPVSEFFSRAGIPINTGGGEATVAELRALREEIRQLRAEMKAGDVQVADAARGAGEKVAAMLDRQIDADDRRGRELVAALPRDQR